MDIEITAIPQLFITSLKSMFQRCFSRHQHDNWRSIFWNIASWNILFHDMINLSCCKHWTDSGKYYCEYHNWIVKQIIGDIKKKLSAKQWITEKKNHFLLWPKLAKQNYFDFKNLLYCAGVEQRCYSPIME